MTPATAAPHEYVIRPSRKSRTASTLRLDLLMEEKQRLEIAERIRVLRERSPFTQPDVADKLGIKLRSYQKLEKQGTTKYERCEELAAIHANWSSHAEGWEHVSADWIWDGRDLSSAESPLDVLSRKQGEASLSEVAAAVEQLRMEMAAMKVELLAAIATVQAEQADQPSHQETAEQR